MKTIKTLEEFANKYQVKISSRENCIKCAEILKNRFSDAEIGEKNGLGVGSCSFFRLSRVRSVFENYNEKEDLTTITIEQFEDMMEEEKQEFKFGQKGWAWHFQDKEVKPCRFLKLNSEKPIIIFLHDDLIIDAEDFSIEKPERFNIGDSILDTSYLLFNENIPRIFTYLGDNKWWNHDLREIEESEIEDSDKLLYTAEQLDDPANYTVHWSYLDEIKEAHARGEVIEFKRWREDDDKWVVVTYTSWLPKYQFRIKPNQKPQIDGLELVEILPDSNGELCVGEHWLSRCLDESSFAGFVYEKDEESPKSYSVGWVDPLGGIRERRSYTNDRCIRPKYVAFIKEK